MQEYWSGLSFSPPGDLPDPGIQLTSPVSPALAGWFFSTVSLGSPIQAPAKQQSHARHWEHRSK